MTPFLSIIIPIYKIKESYLRECFDSLLAQDMKDFQIIAVDDGSPDKSGDICDEYAQKDERVIVYSSGKCRRVSRKKCWNKSSFNRMDNIR